MKSIKKLASLFMLLFSSTTYALDFAAQVSYELSETSPADIVSGDFNNDGNTDMAVAMTGEAGGVGNVSILLGNGAGAFPTHNGLAAIVAVDGLGYTPLGLGIGDFNGDGNLELIVTAGDAGAYDVHIYQGDGTGQFSLMSTVQSGGVSPGAVITADFNGDANLDFAVANSGGSGSGVSVFMGNGVGGFSVAQNISDTATIAAKDIVASDFDHDGDVDIAIPQMVLFNNGSGVFNRFVGIGVTNPRAMALGDMNQDGWVDAIILGSAEVVIWKNNGDGTFSATHQYSETRDVTPSLRGLAVADFDLDSQLDVVFGDELNDEARILTGNGNGTLSATSLSLSVGNEPKNVVSDDWNADGYPDIGAVYRNGGNTPAASILLQQPPGAQPAAGQLQFSAAGYSVNESSVAAVIAVNRIGGSYGAISVNYISSNGSAIAGSDYTFVSGTLHFASGVSTQTITVPLLDDAVIESTETLTLMLSNPVGTTLLAPITAELTIIDNDQPGSFQFSNPVYSVSENGSVVLISVVRLEGSSGTVTVNFSSSDSSATVGNDYLSASGTLSFPDGVLIRTFSVTILNDAIYENTEHLNLTLSNATGGATLGTPTTVSVNILDDDVIPPSGLLQFSDVIYSVAENIATAQITVTRTGGSYGAVSVNYASSDGSASMGIDYIATNGTLNFYDGEISKSFNVGIIDDAVYEGNETISLQLSNASGGAQLGSPVVAALTIIENELLVDVTPPVITVAADMVVDAEGLLTYVELVPAATAIDDQDGPVTVLPNRTGPFEPGRHEIIWSASDLAGNTASEIQRVDVRPLVEFMPDQLAMSGATVKIRVLLNGVAAEYPVQVNYEVFEDSFAVASSAGMLEITSGTEGSFEYTVPADIQGSNITFKLGTVSNAVKGPVATHQVKVISENMAPIAEIKITQNGVSAQMVTTGGGPVMVQVVTSDANTIDTHSYDWSMTDNVLLVNFGLSQTEFVIDPTSLIPGFYRLAVAVTDDGTPALGSEVKRWLQILETAPLLTDTDSDGDGVNDISEGFADSDADGIPNYLDAINNLAVIQGMTGVSEKWLLNVQSGLGIRLGTIALFAGRNTAHVTPQEISLYSGMYGGAAPAETVDTLANIGGYFDFEIYGLTQAGQSALLVIPQHTAIPVNAVYRKYTETTGWKSFVEDGKNWLASAAGEAGLCPPPADSAYVPGLNPGHHCIQLSIEDGGPNDADGRKNGVITDPGGVAALSDGTIPVITGPGPTDPIAVSVSSGGGGGSLFLMPLLWLLVLYRRKVLSACDHR